MELFIMSSLFLGALYHCWELFKEGPSTLFRFFEECEQDRLWIDAHRELAKVDPALALELEYDYKNSIRHYL